ncbi:hypothetical protein AURDEDRAFT_82446 [Auricularia subglabra TFB-10046 SS5]|nr:hypothetical protein AURDEDRAFT_82446 [Auricularia subglabra TFB-10046 SS5]
MHAASTRSIARTAAQRAQTFVALRAFFLGQARALAAPSCTTARLLHTTRQSARSHHGQAAQLRASTSTLPRLSLAQRSRVPASQSRLLHPSLVRFQQQKPGPENETPSEQQQQQQQQQQQLDQQGQQHIANSEQFSRLYKRLAQSFPYAHRPSRDELLSVATNTWQRLRIRFKWFAVRSFRPFNVDDWSAFFSWFLVGQTVWILVGTTTFCMVVIATINSLSLQSNVAQAISNYLTKETGVTVVFESAVVPKWKDSRISFKNVYVSRRPSKDASGAQDDNMSMFDLDIASIDVTLSLWRWLDGKGIVTDCVIKGVRGVLDRTGIQYDPDHPLDPASFRHPAQPGDFELESLQLEDVLITVYQPGHFRPYTASIFRADLRRLRKQWLFYDMLSAESMVGQFDNCLFSVHRPQSIGRTTEEDAKESHGVRMSRFRIDGVNIDHLQYMSGTDGPISWITAGKFDAVLDITFPRNPSEDLDFKNIISEIAANINSGIDDRIPGQRILAKPPLRAPEDEEQQLEAEEQSDRQVVAIDIDIRFRDLKATVPIFTRDLSYVNYALIRPMAAFVNANKTLIPIHCTVVKDLSEFDGSWTMWEAGLIDAIAIKTYDAIAYHVTHNLNRRVKTVSLWGLQVTAQAIVAALRNIVDPVSVHLRDVYLSGGLYDFA